MQCHISLSGIAWLPGDRFMSIFCYREVSISDFSRVVCSVYITSMGGCKGRVVSKFLAFLFASEQKEPPTRGVGVAGPAVTAVRISVGPSLCRARPSLGRRDMQSDNHEQSHQVAAARNLQRPDR